MNADDYDYYYVPHDDAEIDDDAFIQIMFLLIILITHVIEL